MNTYSEYDVDDDLPVNTSSNTNTTAPITNVARISKRGKEAKEDDAPKTIRKPRPKLDFNRLLKGSRGLGYLAVCTKKSLKLSGKPGSEANDLSQICVYLQEWSKRVFPKLELMQFLLKVEDICQSRVMKACVPQILARLKEMGEDVDVRDLETVESEIMTRLATTEAERAMESISAGLETGSNAQASSTGMDFNIDELLTRNRSQRIERSERTEYTDNESEEESEEDEEEYAREMKEFINDRSDDESEKDANDEAEFSDSEIKPANQQFKKGKGITFNFSDDDDEEEGRDSDKQEDLNQDTNGPAASVSTIINDEEIEAPAKKRNFAVIMDSDSD